MDPQELLLSQSNKIHNNSYNIIVKKVYYVKI